MNENDNDIEATENNSSDMSSSQDKLENKEKQQPLSSSPILSPVPSSPFHPLSIEDLEIKSPETLPFNGHTRVFLLPNFTQRINQDIINILKKGIFLPLSVE